MLVRFPGLTRFGEGIRDFYLIAKFSGATNCIDKLTNCSPASEVLKGLTLRSPGSVNNPQVSGSYFYVEGSLHYYENQKQQRLLLLRMAFKAYNLNKYAQPVAARHLFLQNKMVFSPIYLFILNTTTVYNKDYEQVVYNEIHFMMQACKHNGNAPRKIHNARIQNIPQHSLKTILFNMN